MKGTKSTKKSRPRRFLGSRALGLEWRQGTSERIREIIGGLSYRELSAKTGLNRESIRRHVVSGNPSVEFVVMLCRSFDVPADWVLGVRESSKRPTRRTPRRVAKPR